MTEAASLPARIDALNRLYGHAIDDGDYERWPGFFVEDALYKITTRWNHDRAMPAGLMLCQGRAMMEDRVSAIQHRERLRAAPLPAPDRPAGTYPDNRDRRREISAAAGFAVYRTMQSGVPEIFCTGKYVDRIVETGGRLKFSERIVVCDGERIDTMIVLPL